ENARAVLESSCGNNMNIRTRSSWKATTISGIVVVVTLLGCAQVPKESVELSATVGRDIASVHKAHRELAQLVFERMRRDINRFVDNVYAPHQIRAFMEADAKLAKSSSP